MPRFTIIPDDEDDALWEPPASGKYYRAFAIFTLLLTLPALAPIFLFAPVFGILCVPILILCYWRLYDYRVWVGWFFVVPTVGQLPMLPQTIHTIFTGSLPLAVRIYVGILFLVSYALVIWTAILLFKGKFRKGF